MSEYESEREEEQDHILRNQRLHVSNAGLRNRAERAEARVRELEVELEALRTSLGNSSKENEA